MMKITRIALAVCLFGWLSASVLHAAGARAHLVPANNFPVINDSKGFQWRINRYGIIQHTTNYMMNHGNAYVLQINGNNFQTQSSMMIAGTNEYVLSGQANGLKVTRRVRIDTASATVRYVEVFENPGKREISVNAKIYVNMSNRLQGAMTSAGRMPAGALNDKEVGVVAFHMPYGNRPSAVMYLGAKRAAVKPMISINNNVVLNMSFPIKVAPGKTVAIIHGVAQRNMSQSADPKVLARAFRDFTNRKWLAGIPRELLRCAVNMRAGSGMADSLSIDDLGIPAGNSDVLAIGEETRLTGRAACGAMKLKTQFGEKELPLESVLAIAGGSYTKGPVRVFLRDGQILAGELSAEGLCFTLTSGITLNLDPSQLDRLVMRESATPDAVVSDGAEAFVETGAGERLAIAGLAETRLPVVSPWGSRPVAMTEILQLAALRDGLPGWKIMLRDGSKFFAMLDAHEVKLKTVLFGEQTFSLTTLRALNAGQMPEELEPEGAYFELEGDNRIVASLDCPTLDISLDGEMVSVPPTQIRHLAHAEDGPDNAFLIQLWDGGVMSGRIRQTALPLRVGDSLWQVPIGSIVSQVSSTPVISDSLRDRIDKLIRQLGDPDWRLREKASVELGELGYLARQQLSETVQLTDDAEVKRRAEALMEGLK